MSAMAFEVPSSRPTSLPFLAWKFLVGAGLGAAQTMPHACGMLETIGKKVLGGMPLLTAIETTAGGYFICFLAALVPFHIVVLLWLAARGDYRGGADIESEWRQHHFFSVAARAPGLVAGMIFAYAAYQLTILSGLPEILGPLGGLSLLGVPAMGGLFMIYDCLLEQQRHEKYQKLIAIQRLSAGSAPS
ncbi:hypothetical protein DB346_13400 [Verrucomicrobia bacterium LW23]|nr:hypothetical protein DB346_13400 [Verrucomicrobia bacterium LW23]